MTTMRLAHTTLSGRGEFVVFIPIHGLRETRRTVTRMAANKASKRGMTLELWWRGLCHEQHQGGCPPFEPVTFTLNPPANSHPSSAPCAGQLAPPAPLGLGVPNIVMPAGSPFGPAARNPGASSCSTASSSSLSTASSSSLSSTGSAFGSSSSFCPSSSYLLAPKKQEPNSPSIPKDEPTTPSSSFRLNVPPRVTPETRVQLTPTGYARGTMLALAHRQDCASARAGIAAMDLEPGRVPATEPPMPALDPPAPAPAPAPATPCARNEDAAPPRPSVLATLRYGIRGIGVIYASQAAALAAARSLGLLNPKLMVTDNAKKLEQWILGLPFTGEDND
ncbi:hypothetical protein B0H14DRAFT_2635191 [Mycena olivaceomarginata]|nr:hypothetical protein B0H14DRAFT_2635191 [Mycena olivaceomarginata]